MDLFAESTADFSDRLERTKGLCKRQLHTQVDATIDYIFEFFEGEFRAALRRVCPPPPAPVVSPPNVQTTLPIVGHQPSTSTTGQESSASATAEEEVVEAFDEIESDECECDDCVPVKEEIAEGNGERVLPIVIQTSTATNSSGTQQRILRPSTRHRRHHRKRRRIVEPTTKVTPKQLQPRPKTTTASTSNSNSPTPTTSSSSFKPYWCRFEGCGRSFTAHAHLKMHEDIHLGLRPYRCTWPNCGFDATQRNNVVCHIRGVHFKLPTTLKEQQEKNIHDDRDPGEFIETRTDLLALNR